MVMSGSNIFDGVIGFVLCGSTMAAQNANDIPPELNPYIQAIIAAVVGIIGTLLSKWLTGRKKK